MVTAVAAGALAAAGQTMASGATDEQSGAGHSGDGHDHSSHSSADVGGSLIASDTGGSSQAAASLGTAANGPVGVEHQGIGGSLPDPELKPITAVAQDAVSTAQVNAQTEVAKVLKGERLAGARNAAIAAARAAEAEAKRPKHVRPAEGRFTSGYGYRWGTQHLGIDIANETGTPIVSVADGTVVEAGSASGFGLWVRVQHYDGTVTVYGHVHTITVKEGEQVKAGEQIATMGNRGVSTGTHLHFEVWDGSGEKINPAPWLARRGIQL